MSTHRSILCAMAALAVGANAWADSTEPEYVPTPEIIQARQEFADARFGIFLHWGIYSLMGQGEWYLNYGPTAAEYAKAADAFYPSRFDAEAWVSAIKGSGAKYICFTSRHHDGFSMWHTGQSDYNIVDATPYGRDVLRDLADACHNQDVKLHLYYSHIDWTREDYPWGRTGHTTGRDSTKIDWPAYYDFMNRQLTELLTQYGEIGAIWFDGWWDHDEDATPFDWQLPEQYAMIHRLQPSCLIGNNHHQDVNPGEDIQIFERDVPGENTAGYSEQQISRLPLETCQTMNGMWGYKIIDQNYKTTEQLVHYLVRTASQDANLLLNIGPQPNGELPATALERLREMGRWMDVYGETIYGTRGADFAPQAWGAATVKGNKMYVHLLEPDADTIVVPTGRKATAARTYADGKPVEFACTADGISISVPQGAADMIDCIIELDIRPLQ